MPSMKKPSKSVGEERFRRRLERRLRGCVTLPFGRELWDYRTLIEKKKTRKILRIVNTIIRLASTKKCFPYPTVAEEFIKEYEDSDSSYGRDESVLSEGYYIEDEIYRGIPGRKIYLCKKSLFAKKSRADQMAVKIINLKKTLNNYMYDVLPRELDFILRVKHPFIIETYCVIFRRKQYFIFMRYAEKSDLFAHLVDFGPVSETRARIWIGQLANALDYIHSLEIVHRDICCENILITEHNNLKLTDFENAVGVEYDMGRPVPLLDFRGTLEYANPEILAGRPYHAKGADTWALSVVLYCMLTAHLPFAGTNPHQLRESQYNWKMPKSIDFSPELGNLFSKMFQFKSSRRYNLQRFMHAEWLKKDERLSSKSAVAKKCRPGRGNCRPSDDPNRHVFLNDPAQEKVTASYPIRFQPFLRSSPSTCTLIPVLHRDEDLGDTMSEDLSYGIPFTPGDEHKEFLGQLVNAWGRKKRSKQSPMKYSISQGQKQRINDF